ncbi:hypothetical protein Bca4012_057332 [Brassica carinata]
MALKFSIILFIVLWLSFFFLLLDHLYSFNLHHLYSLNADEPSTPNYQDHSLYTIGLVSRKALSHRFDFTPFQPRENNHHHDRPSGEKDGGDEIDPRYGVEKRRVPSGPNPLHH